MTKRPRSSPPPARPGLVRRGGPATPYKRPVQSPDAETVMLAKFTADPDVEPEAPDAERPGDDRLSPQHRAAELSAAKNFSVRNRRETGLPAEDESDEPSTRVLILPHGKRGAGPERFSAPSPRRTWVSRAALGAILCVQAVLSLRLQNTAFGDEALYLYAGHMETAHLLHGAALQGDYASYFPGVPVLYPVLAAAANGVGGLAAARAVSLLAMLITTALLYATTRRLFNERVGLCAAAVFCVAEGVTLRRPPGHQRRRIAQPARAGLLDRGQDRAVALARLPAGCARRRPARPRRLLGAALPAHARAPCGPGGRSVPRPSGARPSPGAGAVTAELLAVGVLVAGRTYVSAAVPPGSAHAQAAARCCTSSPRPGNGAGSSLGLPRSARPATRSGEERANEHVALPGSRRRRIALGIVLAGTALLALADQLHLNTDVPLDTHCRFGLFFAAPMAGVGLARLVGDHFRRAQIGIVVWAAALVLGLGQATQPSAAGRTRPPR